MDTDQEQAAPEAAEQDSDQTADEGSPAQTVRVPNVSANAKSGLDHTVIGANALADDDSDDDQADDSEPDEDGEDEGPPTGDQDAALAWVREAQDSDTAKQRADAVWSEYGEGQGDDSDLAKALRAAVYGDGAASGGDQPDGGQPDGGAITGSAVDQYGSGQQVPSEVVVSQTAGTGEAV